MHLIGQNNSANPLWGIPLQLGWQFSSGRLQTTGNDGYTNCPSHSRDSLCISVTKWWADMNYYLTVLPFIAAFNAGYFKDWPHEIHILKPFNSIKYYEPKSGKTNSVYHNDEILVDQASCNRQFCTDVAECITFIPKAMQEWTSFFKFFDNLPHKLTYNVYNDTEKRSPIEDEILDKMWLGHVHSIHKGLELFRNEANNLSHPERNFGDGWAMIVEFIAATLFLTDLNGTSIFQVSICFCKHFEIFFTLTEYSYYYTMTYILSDNLFFMI